MQEIKGRLRAGHVFSVDTQLVGTVEGDAVVKAGRTLTLLGMVTGDLHIEVGAHVQIIGAVVGSVRNRGGEVTVRGLVGNIADTGPLRVKVASGAIIGGMRA